MSRSDYQTFQDTMFDQIEALEEREKQRIVQDFIDAGRLAGIDVVHEVTDGGRKAHEVLHDIVERIKALKLPTTGMP